MSDDPKPIDPFISILQEELAKYQVEMPGNTEPERLFLFALARSLRNRENELADNNLWVDARNATLTREIASIKAFKLPEAMRCVARLAKRGQKSVKVPGYQFGWTKRAARVSWEPEDKDPLVKWAREFCPDAVTVTQPDPRTNILKTALVEFQSKTGRVPRYCTFVAEGDEPYARSVKEKADE